MNKKIWKLVPISIVSLGSMATVVGCGETTNESKSSSKSGSTTAVNGNTNAPKSTSISNGKFTHSSLEKAYESWQLRYTANNQTATAVDNIIDAMNADPDIQWHAIGEPTIDGINAIRYTMKKSASGDKTLVNYLKVFAQNAFPTQYNVDTTKLGGQDKPFNIQALKDINDWLNGSTEFPFIVNFGNIPGNIDRSTWKNWNNVNYFNDQYKFTKDDVIKTEPLKMLPRWFKTTEYRSQQVEWFGDFDGHNWQATNSQIKSRNSTPSLQGVSAPAVWENLPWGNENFVFTFEANTTGSDPRVLNDNIAKTNIYDGVAGALSTLYDYNDGSGTTGHRSSFYGPNLDAIGYSVVIAYMNKLDQQGSHQMAYLFTHSGNMSEPVSMTQTDLQTRRSELEWLKNAYGQSAVDFAVNSGLSDKFIIQNIVDMKINFGGVEQKWADTIKNLRQNAATIDKPQKIVDEFIKVWQNLNFNNQLWQGDKPASIPTTFDANFLGDNRLSLPREIGWNYKSNNRSVLPYDLLGSGTLSSRIGGTEPISTFESFFN